ncbi:MAG: hypothetical protein RL220_1918 [Bacteroidota bacterium]
MFNKSETFSFAVKTLQGVEPLLADELISLGATDVAAARRVVTCKGDKALMYRMNLMLRTALRVLLPVEIFTALSPDELYVKAKRIPWEELMLLDETFAIDAHVQSDAYRHPHFAALRLKDAIADRFMEKFGRRPNVDTDDPTYRIDLLVRYDHVTISIDTSGYSLNRRGYRVSGGGAPLNEVLAAALVMFTGWTGDSDLHNPMCGSGTIAVEAALMAAHRSPHCGNKKFAFMNWRDFDEGLWNEIKLSELQGHRVPSGRIYASDQSRSQVSLTGAHAKKAGVQDMIEFQEEDFFRLAPLTPSGVMIMNPPYGERMEESMDIPAFYREIGDALKRNWKGTTAWIISSDIAAMKSIGLKPSKRIPLMNGALECMYNAYELFAGNRAEFVKQKKS